MRYIIWFFFIFFIRFVAHTQPNYTAFTVKDGLPSNNVYRCMEDNKGFLWVATDAGIARFDGKQFQVFTIRDGVPDNEVLAVVKEANGRIWINCFKQSPAYFDDVGNRFINSKEDSNLAKVSGTGNIFMYPLQKEGVVYFNEKGSFVFINKKITEYTTVRKNIGFLIKENADGTQFRWGSSPLDPVFKGSQSAIYHMRGSELLDSMVVVKQSSPVNSVPALDNGKLYLFNSQKRMAFVYSGIGLQAKWPRVDSVSIPEPFINFSFTPTCMYLISISGKIYVFDKETLRLKDVISGNYLPNSYFNDSRGNIWISTIDKGLICYRKSQFSHIEIPAGFTGTNFLSIARKKDGTILAGNFYGEVIESKRNIFTVHSVLQIKPARQRKILVSNNRIFTFSELGITVNYSEKLMNPVSKLPYGVKTAVNFNDSIIVIGHYSGLMKLNSITKTCRDIPFTKRITALVKANDSIIYFGSTDGLYKFNYPQNTIAPLTAANTLLRERITALCVTPDNLLWVATPGNGVVVVKNDKVVLNITSEAGLIDNSCRAITTGEPGQVWLGTTKGISVINYKTNGSKLGIAIQNLSVNDGLTNNEINEMVFQNDTVYAATADGISVIPAHPSITVFSIPTELIQISINQHDTLIATKYDLAYHQQNIRMRFAGVELNGHFKNVQYTLDGNKSWVELTTNTLNLQLNSGRHTVEVRAVDVNGNISDKILVVQFNIATPFWKSFWFWLVIAAALQLLTMYLVSRWQKKRKQEKLAKEIASVQTASLEQQAFTSLMNPHFMFNALNSIQHYINVQDRQSANRYLTDFASLIRKNFEAAQQSFIPLDQELENLRIYLRLEQMRFSNRFSYKINIDDSVDTDDWLIPTMVLQPLLENSLLHGIMRSAITGQLSIDISIEDMSLVITITDNGIGIENSRALKQDGDHKSHGMELIKKRITALGVFVSNPITMSLSAAYASAENPGHRVVIVIPDGLHTAWLKAQRK